MKVSKRVYASDEDREDGNSTIENIESLEHLKSLESLGDLENSGNYDDIDQIADISGLGEKIGDGVLAQGNIPEDDERDDDTAWDETKSEFAGMNDEEVIRISQEEGNPAAQDYLINKYRNFVRVKARSYFLIGADREDIIQEGMIGLFKAIRDFRRDKLASFRAFAELCVTRQIITAIKTATRQKHIPLNSYISINKPIYDEDSDRTLLDILPGAKSTDPEELVISREEYAAIASQMETILSDLEWRVLIAYLDGKSYQEISTDLDRHVKSIDNALQRVKRKLEKYMGDVMADVNLSAIYHGLTTINRELHDVDSQRTARNDKEKKNKRIRKKK